jgi:uroporphyrinogen decarboxylase
MGQKPDRVPVVPFALGYTAKFIDISLAEFYADGDKCFDAQIAAMVHHGYEMTPMYGYASIGPWEFGYGIEMPYGEVHHAPFISRHPVTRVEDIADLKVPAFDEGNLQGGYAQADKVARRCIEMGMPITIQAGSTFTSATILAETSTFLKWTMKNPQAAHQLLEKISDMFLGALNFFVGKYGSENCIFFDGGASEANTVISHKIFEQYVYPYLMTVHGGIKDLGVQVVMMHACADQNKNIPYYVQLREVLGWHGKYCWLFGPETPIPKQIEAFGHHDVICGNVDPVAFHTKSYDEILALCRENIALGMHSPSGFILSPGCEMPCNAEPKQVSALVDAAGLYGKYE